MDAVKQLRCQVPGLAQLDNHFDLSDLLITPRFQANQAAAEGTTSHLGKVQLGPPDNSRRQQSGGAAPVHAIDAKHRAGFAGTDQSEAGCTKRARVMDAATRQAMQAEVENLKQQNLGLLQQLVAVISESRLVTEGNFTMRHLLAAVGGTGAAGGVATAAAAAAAGTEAPEAPVPMEACAPDEPFTAGRLSAPEGLAPCLSQQQEPQQQQRPLHMHTGMQPAASLDPALDPAANGAAAPETAGCAAEQENACLAGNRLPIASAMWPANQEQQQQKVQCAAHTDDIVQLNQVSSCQLDLQQQQLQLQCWTADEHRQTWHQDSWHQKQRQQQQQPCGKLVLDLGDADSEPAPKHVPAPMLQQHALCQQQGTSHAQAENLDVFKRAMPAAIGAVADASETPAAAAAAAAAPVASMTGSGTLSHSSSAAEPQPAPTLQQAVAVLESSERAGLLNEVEVQQLTAALAMRSSSRASNFSAELPRSQSFGEQLGQQHSSISNQDMSGTAAAGAAAAAAAKGPFSEAMVEAIAARALQQSKGAASQAVLHLVSAGAGVPLSSTSTSVAGCRSSSI